MPRRKLHILFLLGLVLGQIFGAAPALASSARWTIEVCSVDPDSGQAQPAEQERIEILWATPEPASFAFRETQPVIPRTPPGFALYQRPPPVG